MHLLVGASHAAGLQPNQDAKRAFKYPYVACEVFCCNSDSIMQSFLSNEDLLSKLFSALDLPRPLNCVLAGVLILPFPSLFQNLRALPWNLQPSLLHAN